MTELRLLETEVSLLRVNPYKSLDSIGLIGSTVCVLLGEGGANLIGLLEFSISIALELGRSMLRPPVF